MPVLLSAILIWNFALSTNGIEEKQVLPLVDFPIVYLPNNLNNTQGASVYGPVALSVAVVLPLIKSSY